MSTASAFPAQDTTQLTSSVVKPIDTRIELLAILTTVVLLFHAPGVWYTKTPLVVVLICGLIRRELVQMPAFWLTVCALVALDLRVAWFYVDNHKFLELYWCLTLFCALCVGFEARERILRGNARLILGLVMGFAVLWKAISISYMSGTFFEYVLITDIRFEHMAHWFAGIEYESLTQNRATLNWLKTSHLDGHQVLGAELISNPAVRRLALGMTWWTIGIEALIGLLYFLPSRIKNIGAIRDYGLLIFATTTYLFAPVVGFGWLLMILGAAQTENQNRLRLFCIVFVLIRVYELPYANFVNNLIGG